MFTVQNTLRYLAAFVALTTATSGALVGVANAQDSETVGCGTATLEHSLALSGVDLVGNAGPAKAAVTVDLGVELAPGDYLVRAISMDSHWDEAPGEDQERFFVTIGDASTDAIDDLPRWADFLGSDAAQATDQNLSTIAPAALPGADLGVVALAGGESTATFTHTELGSGTQANSISAAMVSIACAATGVDISFADTSVDANGNAKLTLNVANTSGQDHTGIRIRSRLPVGVAQVGDIVMTAGSSTTVGKVVRWEGDVAAGETAQVVLPVQTSEAGLGECVQALDTDVCQVIAQLVGVDGAVPTATDAVADLEIVTSTDLELTMTYVPTGQNETALTGRVTAIVTNASASVATVTADDVIVHIDTGSDLKVDRFTSAATLGTVQTKTNGQQWNVGSLAPGQRAALTLNVELPLAGEYSVKGQVASASGNDLDSTPGNLTNRSSRTDTATSEDDEAAVLAIAKPATTTTTTTTISPTTTAPTAIVVPVEADGFRLVLPDGVDLPEQVSTTPDLGADGDDELRTEVAGAVEERPAVPVGTVELQQGDDKAPLAISIVAALVALVAAALYLERRRTDASVAAAISAGGDNNHSARTTRASHNESDTTDPWNSAGH